MSATPRLAMRDSPSCLAIQYIVGIAAVPKITAGMRIAHSFSPKMAMVRFRSGLRRSSNDHYF